MNKRAELILFGTGIWWWVRHVPFWIFMYFDEVFFTISDKEGFQDLETVLIPLVLDIIIVYINFYILIPVFLNKKKYVSYFAITIGSIVVSVALTFVLLGGLEFWPDLYSIMGTLIATFTLLATAIAIKIGKHSYEQLKITEQLKLSQSKLELNFLKQQINPHFLFNVLNTIHIQSKTDSSSVSDTVLQLSDLLRYQIYDAGASESVPLSKEIDFIKNYVLLEKLRRTNLDLQLSISDELPKIRITPFLFLPLIENAFKHSRSISDQKCIIDISFTSKNSSLELTVSNSIGDTQDKENGGFGIDNLKKRLNLLYPSQYVLDLSIKNGLFISTLILTLNESHNNR